MSQKYRHKGYQDNDRERRPEREYFPPGEKPEFKRVEKQVREQVLRCQRCGERIELRGTIGMSDTCRNCNNDLWCCANCAWFDPGATWECRKPIPARVMPKDKRNTCELFEPRLVADIVGKKTAAPGPVGTSDARRAFDALFKK